MNSALLGRPTVMERLLQRQRFWQNLLLPASPVEDPSGDDRSQTAMRNAKGTPK